jgi:hypothetical protein
MTQQVVKWHNTTQGDLTQHHTIPQNTIDTTQHNWHDTMHTAQYVATQHNTIWCNMTDMLQHHTTTDMTRYDPTVRTCRWHDVSTRMFSTLAHHCQNVALCQYLPKACTCELLLNWCAQHWQQRGKRGNNISLACSHYLVSSHMHISQHSYSVNTRTTIQLLEWFKWVNRSSQENIMHDWSKDNKWGHDHTCLHGQFHVLGGIPSIIGTPDDVHDFCLRKLYMCEIGSLHRPKGSWLTVVSSSS